MYRFALDYLKEWKEKASRKPLVIRGARQVGKSFLVKMFADQFFDDLVEINFERTPDVASLFVSKSPATTINLLEARYNKNIRPGKTLLFLDEVQAAPELFASLRYFFEEMPQMHVISAGSLLEFVLKDHEFSMPVGRIEYLHLGPMQFEEFLIAVGKEKLSQFLATYSIGQEMPLAIHDELMRSFRDFLIIGGMPEVVKAFAGTGLYRESDEVKQSIISTYRDDFNKYRRRVDPARMGKVFNAVPKLVGNKFKYSNVDREERSRDIKQSLELLSLARVVYPVYHSACNGVPLGAESDDRIFKTIFLDVGLMSSMCGLSGIDVESTRDVMTVNGGSVCEQFTAQHLYYLRDLFEEPQLYYWMREKKNSSAEVDYVISIGTDIIPVEVKSGKAGTMKSLHVFLREKGRSFALRFNAEPPSLMEAKTSPADGNSIPFRLLSLPLYLAGQTRRLCASIIKQG